MLFICYPKCSTGQKAKQWLDEHYVEYTERHIVENNPSYEELKLWHEQSGFQLKKFFNTSGLLYKEMELKNKLLGMSEEEQLQLLATNGMLVKRPIVVMRIKCLWDSGKVNGRSYYKYSMSFDFSAIPYFPGQ